MSNGPEKTRRLGALLHNIRNHMSIKPHINSFPARLSTGTANIRANIRNKLGRNFIKLMQNYNANQGSSTGNRRHLTKMMEFERMIPLVRQYSTHYNRVRTLPVFHAGATLNEVAHNVNAAFNRQPYSTVRRTNALRNAHRRLEAYEQHAAHSATIQRLMNSIRSHNVPAGPFVTALHTTGRLIMERHRGSNNNRVTITRLQQLDNKARRMAQPHFITAAANLHRLQTPKLRQMFTEKLFRARNNNDALRISTQIRAIIQGIHNLGAARVAHEQMKQAEKLREKGKAKYNAERYAAIHHGGNLQVGVMFPKVAAGQATPFMTNNIQTIRQKLSQMNTSSQGYRNILQYAIRYHAEHPNAAVLPVEPNRANFPGPPSKFRAAKTSHNSEMKNFIVTIIRHQRGR